VRGYLNCAPAGLEPSAVEARSATRPLPFGAVAVSRFGVCTLTALAGLPPKYTVVALATKSVPVITVEVPAFPICGVTEVTVGAE
jgi:hypothetical protein